MTKPLEKTQAQRLEVVENKITEIDKVVCDMIDRSNDLVDTANAEFFALEDRVEKLETAPKKTSVGLSLGIVGAAITIALTALSVLGLALTPLQIALPMLVALGAAAALTFAEKKGFQWFVMIVDMTAVLLFGALLLTVLIPAVILLSIGRLIVPARDLVLKGIKIVVDMIGGVASRGKRRAEFAIA